MNIKYNYLVYPWKEGMHWSYQEEQNTENHRKTCVEWQRNIFPGEKSPFTTVGQIKHFLQEEGISVSMSAIERKQRVSHKMLTNGKPQKPEGQISICQKHLKMFLEFWNNTVWRDNTKINLFPNDGKRRLWRPEGTAHCLNYTILSCDKNYLVECIYGSTLLYRFLWKAHWWCVNLLVV